MPEISNYEKLTYFCEIKEAISLTLLYLGSDSGLVEYV